jgi:hypothetical protein
LAKESSSVGMKFGEWENSLIKYNVSGDIYSARGYV